MLPTPKSRSSARASYGGMGKKPLQPATTASDGADESVAQSALKQKEMSNEAFQAEARLRKLMTEQPLMTKLGEALSKKKVRVVDLLRSWDKGGSGSVTRLEFLSHVRDIIDADEGSDTEVHSLFDALRLRGSTSGGLSSQVVEELRLADMKIAVKHMVQMASDNEAEKWRVATSAAALRERSEQAKQALVVVKATREEEARIATLVSRLQIRV